MYNLLLVDDEPLIKVAFQSAVEWGKNGFLLAATASNGQEALHIVETQHIDAVITDLKMPGMDGLALIHELKKRSFIGPILVLSNYSDFDSVRTALTDGAYDYFLKINMNGESIGEHLKKMADLLRVQQQRQTEEDHRSFALQIGGTPYNWILDSSLPGVQFGDFNSVLLVIIGVIANGSVALIALILVVILAWNYLKLLLEAAERYVVLGILVFTAPLAFAMGAARGTNNIFKSWCQMFGGQLLLLIMNAWCLKLFINMVGEFLANPLSL